MNNLHWPNISYGLKSFAVTIPGDEDLDRSQRKGRPHQPEIAETN